MEPFLQPFRMKTIFTIFVMILLFYVSILPLYFNEYKRVTLFK